MKPGVCMSFFGHLDNLALHQFVFSRIKKNYFPVLNKRCFVCLFLNILVTVTLDFP